MAKFCVSCGKELADGETFCSGCGTKVEEQQQTTIVNNITTVQPKKSNGLAIAGFVTSLVSTFLCCGSLSLISLILSIVGMVQINKNGDSGKGLAIAGIIISAIGLIIIILLGVLYGAVIASEIGSVSTY